jgi:hypothetical protein
VVLDVITTIYCIVGCEIRNGSDGHCSNNYDFSSLNLHEKQEIVDLLFYEVSTSNTRFSVPRSSIPEDKWDEIVQRNANGESLRKLAVEYIVSYETIRQIIKKMV